MLLLPPKKRFSQNFLKDKSIVSSIIAKANFKSSSLLIEVGSGRGALTEPLLQEGLKVLAIEIDTKLCHFLGQKYVDNPNFSIINEDILEFQLEKLAKFDSPNNINLISNLPYHIASPIIFKLIKHRYLFAKFVIMIQTELALRLTAKLGSLPKKNISFLTVASNMAFDSKILLTVPKTAFYPQPKVNSSVVELIPHYTLPTELEDKFLHLAKILYSSRRKTIKTTLSKHYPEHLKSILYSTEATKLWSKRPEDLSWNEWLTLLTLLDEDT